MKENADAYFGDDSNNNRRRSSGDVSTNSAPESYRVEDDPFVWENFRREQAEKRETFRKVQRDSNNGGYPQPEPKRSRDNSGQEWRDDWWRANDGDSSGPAVLRGAVEEAMITTMRRMSL